MKKELLRLAIPNILSNISVPLLSSVDTALMGHLSASHLGAVGVAGMIFNFLYWNFGFLRMGTTGLTAQAVGADDQYAQSATLLSAAALAILFASILIALQYPLFELSTILMNLDGSNFELVKDYFSIRIWAAPASLLLYVLMGWFFGQQNSVFPLYITLCANVANILSSIYLVKFLGFGIAGAAYGTVFAQYVSLFFAFYLLNRKYPEKLQAMELKWLKEIQRFKKLFQVNFDIFLRTLCLSIAFGFFYSKSAEISPLALAVTTVLLQFLNWMSYAVDGFAFAAEALVGKYFGAKDEKKAWYAIKVSMVYGLGLAVLFSLLYGFAGQPLIDVFTVQESVRALAYSYILYVVLLPLIGTACYIWDGVFVGLTATQSMRNTMLIALAGYLVSYFVLINYTDALSALWISLLFFLGFRGLLQSVWYWKFGLKMT